MLLASFSEICQRKQMKADFIAAVNFHFFWERKSPILLNFSLPSPGHKSWGRTCYACGYVIPCGFALFWKLDILSFLFQFWMRLRKKILCIEIFKSCFHILTEIWLKTGSFISFQWETIWASLSLIRKKKPIFRNSFTEGKT